MLMTDGRKARYGDFVLFDLIRWEVGESVELWSFDEEPASKKNDPSQDAMLRMEDKEDQYVVRERL